MKQPEVFKKIGGIIRELNDQYEYLQASVDHMNDLELELFVANAHFLKDHAEILRKLNAIKGHAMLALPKHEDKPAAKKLSTNGEPKWFEPVVQPVKPPAERAPFKPEPPKPAEEESIKFEISPPEEPAPTIDLSPVSTAGSYAFEREEPEVIRHELILDESNTYDEDDNNLTQDEVLLTPVAEIQPEPEIEIEPVKDPEPEPTPEPVEEPEPEPAPVEEAPKVVGQAPQTASMEDIQVAHLNTVKADPIKKDADVPALTLNQRLSAQLKEGKKGEAEEAIEPLADIKTAINLNDKLLFVKDLFKGYNLAYTEAIEIVNRFSSFEEADRFLRTNYVTKNNWEEKKSTSDKFYALLRRRYA